MAKLLEEHIVTIRVLNERGESKCSIARTLGVTEGAVRYHLRRQASGAVDGRRKILQLEALGLADATEQWWEAQQAALPNDRPPNIESLHAWLQAEHGYDGSYKSVRKFVRRHFPAHLLFFHSTDLCLSQNRPSCRRMSLIHYLYIQ